MISTFAVSHRRILEGVTTRDDSGPPVSRERLLHKVDGELAVLVKTPPLTTRGEITSPSAHAPNTQAAVTRMAPPHFE